MGKRLTVFPAKRSSLRSRRSNKVVDPSEFAEGPPDSASDRTPGEVVSTCIRK